MTDQPSNSSPAPVKRFPLLAAIVLCCAVIACSIYANLSFAVKNRANYRFFPPFQSGYNANMNRHLGAEYFNIAQSLVNGEGFAHPFGQPTGPTAWMPPVLPILLAGLLWVSDGDREVVMVMVIVLQVLVLMGTGLLVLALARQTTRRMGDLVVAALFLGGLACHFRLCFQFTHDCWLVLLALDVLIAGLCWFRPLQSWQAAAGWGLLGGLFALINPIVALAWGLFSLLLGVQQRTWPRLALALLVAGLTLAPWSVRNYRVFGRWIPVKSNLAYELYQSQCLQPDGMLQHTTFRVHPYAAAGRERQAYKELGEIVYLEQKQELFRQAVGADPADFLERVASRFLGAMIWYEPFNRPAEVNRPWVLWTGRLTHPLPFLALLVLVLTAVREPLHRAQWIVAGVYLLYLLPYIGASYYERYAMPLLGVKVLLVIWAIDRLLAFWPRGSSSFSSEPQASAGELVEAQVANVPGERPALCRSSAPRPG